MGFLGKVVSIFRERYRRTIVALGFLIVAAVIEYAVGHSDPVWVLIYHIIRDIGIAFIIAIILAAGIESEHRKQLRGMLEEKVGSISENVFKGVYNVELPREYVSETVSLAIKNNFVRTGTQVIYWIRSQQEGADEFVTLDTKISFTIKNISHKNQVLPMKLLLPRPTNPARASHSIIADWKVTLDGGDREIPFPGFSVDMREANAQLQELINTEDDLYCKIELGKIDLAVQQEAHVTARYVMVKEIDDTEILKFLHPTKGVSVNIYGADMFLIKGRSIHRHTCELGEPLNDAQTLSQRDYFLPHQGIHIWWKRKRPSDSHTVGRGGP